MIIKTALLSITKLEALFKRKPAFSPLLYDSNGPGGSNLVIPPYSDGLRLRLAIRGNGPRTGNGRWHKGTSRWQLWIGAPMPTWKHGWIDNVHYLPCIPYWLLFFQCWFQVRCVFRRVDMCFFFFASRACWREPDLVWVDLKLEMILVGMDMTFNFLADLKQFHGFIDVLISVRKIPLISGKSRLANGESMVNLL